MHPGDLAAQVLIAQCSLRRRPSRPRSRSMGRSQHRLAEHRADRLDTPPQSAVGAVLVLGDEPHERVCGRSSSAAKKAEAARLSHESCWWLRRFVSGCWGGDREDHGVGYNFVAGDRDQLMLLPPSVADWLPEDHLAWFVLDVVAELDLSAFHAGYRLDGRGGAAYDP